jgi:hypothetical protein
VTKLRFTVRASALAFTTETLRAFGEIMVSCGGKFAIGPDLNSGAKADFIFAVHAARDTAKRLHTLACEWDARATLTEG